MTAGQRSFHHEAFHFSSSRRADVALVAGLGLLGAHSTAFADDYSGAGVLSGVHSSDNVTIGKLHGKSNPGGQFKGTFSFVSSEGGTVLDGEATYAYRNGSISLHYDVVWDDDLGGFVGTFTITGGTGAYEGATGDGDLVVVNGKFTLNGTIWP